MNKIRHRYTNVYTLNIGPEVGINLLMEPLLTSLLTVYKMDSGFVFLAAANIKHEGNYLLAHKADIGPVGEPILIVKTPELVLYDRPGIYTLALAATSNHLFDHILNDQ